MSVLPQGTSTPLHRAHAGRTPGGQHGRFAAGPLAPVSSTTRALMYPISVKGVLLSPKRELVLLLNEREEWELPGGRIEIGESSTECLAREIREELNIEVDVGAPIDTYLFEVAPGKRVFIATYRCALVGSFNPSISHEHKRLGLFSLAALPANLPAGYRTSVQAVYGEP